MFPFPTAENDSAKAAYGPKKKGFIPFKKGKKGARDQAAALKKGKGKR